MAQNISLLGANYSAVPAVTLPKQGGGTARFDDCTVTTATAEDVASGKVFIASDGTITTGTSSGGGGSVVQDGNGYIILPKTGDGASIEDMYDVVLHCEGWFGTGSGTWTLVKGSNADAWQKIDTEPVYALIHRHVDDDGSYDSETINDVHVWSNWSNGDIGFSFIDTYSTQYIVVLTDEDAIVCMN